MKHRGIAVPALCLGQRTCPEFSVSVRSLRTLLRPSHALPLVTFETARTTPGDMSVPLRWVRWGSPEA